MTEVSYPFNDKDLIELIGSIKDYTTYTLVMMLRDMPASSAFDLGKVNYQIPKTLEGQISNYVDLAILQSVKKLLPIMEVEIRNNERKKIALEILKDKV